MSASTIGLVDTAEVRSLLDDLDAMDAANDNSTRAWAAAQTWHARSRRIARALADEVDRLRGVKTT